MNAERVRALIRTGELFHQRGWMPATAGNLSFRDDDGTLAITRSGSHKGELAADDIIAIDELGRPLERDRKCSAETVLHCQLYQRFSTARSVLHTHSVPATVLSRRRDRVRFHGYEVLKALEGITTHDTTVELPVFENDQDIPRLSTAVGAWLDSTTVHHGYLIRGHGLYAWAETVELARYRIEALEFLLECESRTKET